MFSALWVYLKKKNGPKSLDTCNMYDTYKMKIKLALFQDEETLHHELEIIIKWKQTQLE